MACLNTIIKKIEPKNVDKEWNNLNLHERMKSILIIRDELTTMIQKCPITSYKIILKFSYETIMNDLVFKN